MGNYQAKNSEIPISYFSLYNSNYLNNCHKYLIRSKYIHFIITLIETLLNINQELYIFYIENNLEKNNANNFVQFLLFIPENIQGLPMIIKIIIVLLYILIFDTIYYFLGKLKYKKDNIYLSILFNIIELFYFRISMLIFLNVFFCLSYIYFVLLLVLLIPHIYLTSYHFFYNHLYVFVPVFIDFPFDEFSSLFDIFSLVVKILFSILGNIKNINVRKCIYIITFIFLIFCCIIFIYHLIFHSYLFMKNLFLNKAKVSLFLIQTIVLIFSELIGQNGIANISFLVIFISLFIIIIFYVQLLYDPKVYIAFKRETPYQNMLYFLFILSNEIQPYYLIENKIGKHFEGCGICEICKKYIRYLNKSFDYFEFNENENTYFINKEFCKNQDRLINIFFDILYNGKNKYFYLIKEMILLYQSKKLLDNISYFYINLSFLIFSELKNNNYILARNLQIILDEINKSNKLQDIHAAQIKGIILCDDFLTLVHSTLKQIKNILKSEESQAIKFLKLSESLNEMKKPKYKEIFFSNKHDNVSNSRNIIYVCSLLYEEIFNTILNSNQVALRENYQIFEDNFINNDKIERIISLSLNLVNCYCKIVRAGKDLYCYRDNNLFDLIPLIFKDYLQKVFITKISSHFNSNILDSKEKYNEISKNFNNHSDNVNFDSKKENRIIKRTTMKRDSLRKNINKTEYFEFKMIISENISSKIFYRLLILKLTPLFNYDYNNCFILLDGSFKLYKNTIMTMQEIKNQGEMGQRIISVSKPEIEFPPGIYSITFQKYLIEIEKRNFRLVKILDFPLSKKLITIYTIVPKDKEAFKKLRKTSFYSDETIKFGYQLKLEKKTSKKIQYYFEDTASVKSQQTSTKNNLNFNSAFNIKAKKKEDIYRNSNLYIIENIIYIMIPLIILFTIIQVIHLMDLKKGDFNNDYSLICFNEFYKLYFQIFSSILSITCIRFNSSCINIMSTYSQKVPGLDYYFNCSQFFYGQNQVLLKSLLDKKSKLVDIHQNIGKNKYKEIFEQQIEYTRISKIFKEDIIDLNLMKVNIIFSEAILIAINSFQLITNNTFTESIYILNKKEEPFLYFDNYGNNSKNLSDFQKELYEMILNYDVFWEQFRYIYYKLLEALAFQTKNIKFYIYFYYNVAYSIILIILILLYIYMYNFEELIMKIMNHVNMIINSKDDNFNFFKEFSKKISNLEIILKIYSDNPIKAVHDLISIYNKYEKYITNQKKNILADVSKKGNKKSVQAENIDELLIDNVPRHLKIIKREDKEKLYIMFTYHIITLIIIICLVLTYISLHLLWRKYYLIKDNLYSLLRKDTELEMSFFKALNIYDLMIFDNYTLDELARDIFYDENKKVNDEYRLLNSFYEDLYLAYNFEIEIKVLVKEFSGFPYFNFTCQNLYYIQSDNIKELEENPEIKKIGNIKDKMYVLCSRSNIDYFNDMNVVFGMHYQTIVESIIGIEDFSYKGLIQHLKNGFFGQIYLTFNLILMYITDIINVKFHKVEYDNLLEVLSNYLIITIVLLIILYIIIMSIVIFFYISRFKNFCSQIILLKQVFQLCEVHEQ